MYQPTVKIKYGWIKEVSWPIVILFLLDYLNISKEQQFILTGVGIFLIIGFAKRIFIPDVVGCKVYIISIIVMLINGFIQNRVRDFSKGTFYVLSTIAVVVLGYYLARISKKVSFEKTICVIGVLIGIKDIFNVVTNPSLLTDMQSLRDALEIHNMDLMIILVILFYECVIVGKVLFTKRKDIVIITFIAAVVLLSMGRTQIIGSIIGIFMAFLLTLLKGRNKAVAVKKAFALVISGTILIILALNVIPEETITPFIDKMENSFTEVSSNDDFSNSGDINNHWRGYENKSALEQWKNANVFEEIIGQGVGKGIELNNLDAFYQQKYGLVDSESPILHSGYHSLLVKGGLLAVIGLIIWFITPMVLCLKTSISNQDKIHLYIKMSAVNASMMFATYVVRGVFTASVFLAWSLAMGWYSFEIRKMKK